MKDMLQSWIIILELMTENSNLLSSGIDYSKVGKISSHSFTIGIWKLEYSDNEIMTIGRWSSSAFELISKSNKSSCWHGRQTRENNLQEV